MAAPPPMPRTRPLGVTILAILTILVGIGLLLLGLLVIAVSTFITVFAPMFGLPLIAIGGLVLLVGILLLVSGFGLLKLRMWAWWLAIISFVLAGVSSILSQSYVSAVIEVLLIVYLIVVRKHFH
ncbi:MAG: hypothetical protein E6K16_01365 [Methanobacteriota archaeon]|nr:MAG: hypothetical protein E6K16_01365 [Euryarchaeota archaeon]